MILAVWDVTASTIVGRYHRFREVLCIQLQGNLAVKILTSQMIRKKNSFLIFQCICAAKAEQRRRTCRISTWYYFGAGDLLSDDILCDAQSVDQNAEVCVGMSPYIGGLHVPAFYYIAGPSKEAFALSPQVYIKCFVCTYRTPTLTLVRK